MPRQARESSGTGFTAPVGEIDWDWEKHDISHVTQVPVPVFPITIWLVYHKWWKWNKMRDILKQRLKEAKY